MNRVHVEFRTDMENSIVIKIFFAFSNMLLRHFCEKRLDAMISENLAKNLTIFIVFLLIFN